MSISGRGSKHLVRLTSTLKISIRNFNRKGNHYCLVDPIAITIGKRTLVVHARCSTLSPSQAQVISTLSRVEQGNLPDIDTYVKICNRLEVSTDFFTDSAEDTTERKIVAHLRADKALPKETAEALIKMIKLAYKAHE